MWGTSGLKNIDAGVVRVAISACTALLVGPLVLVVLLLFALPILPVFLCCLPAFALASRVADRPVSPPCIELRSVERSHPRLRQPPAAAGGPV